MRLFTGIALPADVTDKLDRLVRGLRPAARIKWSPVKNLHITTKFIGEWPEERLGELKTTLGELPVRDQLRIGVGGLGWFPNERSPRVLWAGIEAPQGLHELARETQEALAGIGVEIEKRRYSPHLTLARIKTPTDLKPLRLAIENLASTEFGEFTAPAFHLYLSESQAGGPIYTSLAEFAFRPTER
jgi:RNA 2',3'-cyclic 3'-phosphodiesterase